MVDAFSNQKPEFQQLKKVLDALFVGVGVLFLGYTIVQFYAQWTQLDRQALFLKLALPAWLTIGVLPFIYVLSLYTVYEGALRGVNWATSDWRARWRTRFVLVRDFRLRRNELRSFTLMWIKRAAVAPDVTGARAVVQQFRDEQRAAEQAERDAEERLWRYAGSNKTDTEGRRDNVYLPSRPLRYLSRSFWVNRLSLALACSMSGCASRQASLERGLTSSLNTRVALVNVSLALARTSGRRASSRAARMARRRRRVMAHSSIDGAFLPK